MMDDDGFQTSLPQAPWMEPALWKLPGTVPVDPESWVLRDEAFAKQMAERDRLIADHDKDVLASTPEAQGAVEECLEALLATLGKDDGYRISPREVQRPDGKRVALDRDAPLRTIGRLVQEDVCILEEGPAGEHVLVAAALCFPASWTLAEKIGRPLSRIHAPVEDYSADLAARVQRMFSKLRPDTSLMRMNALLYHEPDLYQPNREGVSHRQSSAEGRYMRSERQTLRRLPVSGAIVFTIHTFVVALANLTDAQRDTLYLVSAKYAE